MRETRNLRNWTTAEAKRLDKEEHVRKAAASRQKRLEGKSKPLATNERI